MLSPHLDLPLFCRHQPAVLLAQLQQRAQCLSLRNLQILDLVMQREVLDWGGNSLSRLCTQAHNLWRVGRCEFCTQ